MASHLHKICVYGDGTVSLPGFLPGNLQKILYSKDLDLLLADVSSKDHILWAFVVLTAEESLLEVAAKVRKIPFETSVPKIAFVPAGGRLPKCETFDGIFHTDVDWKSFHQVVEQSWQELKGEQKSILVIDDDADVLLAMSAVLQSYDYKVLTAKDGGEGLRIIKHREPDLVLSDIQMGQINGFILLQPDFRQ